MQTYLVGGAIRDALLGQPGSDRDWVVVGATPEQMVAQGFLPVGRDFPVFLHPRTREQYALARTERKSAPGYRGFTVHAAPEVTLEEDLARRDLTINSIALPAEMARAAGQVDIKNPDHLIDPFHGRRDLQHKLLRHVTDAFRVDHRGAGSFARVMGGIAALRAHPAGESLFSGLLAVIDPRTDPSEIYHFFKSVQTPSVDFLYRDGNHDVLPFGKAATERSTEVW